MQASEVERLANNSIGSTERTGTIPRRRLQGWQKYEALRFTSLSPF